MTSRADAVLDAFTAFRSELDDYNDRRERLIKASRDVTTASKRLIFLLHRYPHAAFGLAPSSMPAAGRKLIEEATAKRAEIVAMITDVAKREGLDENGDAAQEPGRAARYDRAFGPGLEEFIEAVSFLHFLQYGTIMTLQEAQALFVEPSSGRCLLPVTPQRFLLGLSDLSGELMRFATNALGAGDAQGVVSVVLVALRDLSSGMDPFVPLIRDFRRKQTVTMQSTRKIEDLSYAVTVRTSEYGSDQKALQEMVRRALAGGSSGPVTSGDDAEFDANS